ncbi:O-methyltransferase [Ilumatobacter sp.]|uniref:O-methyltransferase n=1 Tax=Ilumatobacter sp. TaxID=1967498 RepID=UPI003C722BF3
MRPVTPLGIVAERIEALSADLVEGVVVDAGVVADLAGIRALASGLDPYLELCSSPASEALASLDRRTTAQEWNGFGTSSAAPTLEAEMLSGHVEGRLLGLLVAMSGASRVLEVGMFTGYSALAMAEALPDDGVLIALEIDPEVADFARTCFDDSPDGDKIEVRVGPAADTLREFAGSVEAFDFVFIDADKAGYADYLDLIVDDGLLAPGGTICVDNTLMQGQSYLEGDRSANGEAIAAFNDKVARDPRLEQVLLPVRDGFTLIRRSRV